MELVIPVITVVPDVVTEVYRANPVVIAIVLVPEIKVVAYVITVVPDVVTPVLYSVVALVVVAGVLYVTVVIPVVVEGVLYVTVLVPVQVSITDVLTTVAVSV